MDLIIDQLCVRWFSRAAFKSLCFGIFVVAAFLFCQVFFIAASWQPAIADDHVSGSVPKSPKSCPDRIPGTEGDAGNGCPAKLNDFYAGLSFTNDNHREWYERFWTGDCSGVSGFCLSGRPNWSDTVSHVIKKLETNEVPHFRYRLWRLGRLVGHEWAKENDVRKIHTSHTRKWDSQLRKADQLEKVLSEIEKAAQVALKN